MATLTMLARDTLLAPETDAAIGAAEQATATLPSDSVQRRAVSQARHALAYHRRIPDDLLRRKAELKAVSQAAWVKAREQDDFASFRPYLETQVDLGRRIADAIGHQGHPYDALVAIFEPGETAASLTRLFGGLRAGIAPLLSAIRQAPAIRTDFLERDFPVEGQARFARRVAEAVGYDFGRGRLDTTVHPFEISFTRNDVRITTRFHRNWLPAGIFGALHEAGHGIYEQGVDPAFTRSVLATDLIGLYAVGGVSFGAHESQSRLFENHVGRARSFWDLHFPALQAEFPVQLGDIDTDTFHHGVNAVRPGFIRVEADELTYDLHIMLRVELEIALIEGTLKVADLPQAWAEIVRRDLGLTVPDHRRGVLQDIHWSGGQIGTFCNYTIGNVMAAQLFEAALAAVPAIKPALERGDYGPLRSWLGEHVHQHGRRFTRDELLVRATGRALDPAPYLSYLTQKYSALYGVSVA